MFIQNINYDRNSCIVTNDYVNFNEVNLSDLKINNNNNNNNYSNGQNSNYNNYNNNYNNRRN
jgi:hypothetical protein